MSNDRDDSPARVGLGFVVQFFATGPLLFVVMMFLFVHASADYDGGLSAIAWVFGGGYYTAVTVGIVAVTGLPLRLKPHRLAWWRAHWWVAPAGIAVGAALLLWGSVRGSDATRVVEGYREYVDNGNLGLALLGWFVLAFSVMHTWPPPRRRRAPDSTTVARLKP